MLTVGDQVYLDNPPKEAIHLTEGGFAKAFEEKYRNNWQTDTVGAGYAEILRAAPVAAIPDDHEYWNNYPRSGGLWSTPWPATRWRKTRNRWQKAARDMYDAFQLGDNPERTNNDAYCYEINVAPLSFFMMDNRTFREEQDTASGKVMSSMLGGDLTKYRAWVQRMIATPDAVPVLVTGPSLLQPPSETPGRDLNFADVVEYPSIMEGLLLMTRQGCSPLALTGDVHYPRVTQAEPKGGSNSTTPANPWGAIHEVISSPASIVLMQHDRRSEPNTSGFAIAAGKGAKLACSKLWPAEPLWPGVPDALLGNHVAVLEFTRRATGVDLSVRYCRVLKRGEDHSVEGPTIHLRRTPVPTAPGNEPRAVPDLDPSLEASAGLVWDPTTGPVLATPAQHLEIP